MANVVHTVSATVGSSIVQFIVPFARIGLKICNPAEHLGLLEKMIPEFSKIDTLPQFDRFHSLSVGQHTLKALNTLKNLQDTYDESYKFANQVLKKVKNKKPLFYAVLLHDIGKGLGGEHNLKGAKKAKKIILNLNENTDTVKETTWLIENHMLLSEFAFKKDIEDDSVIKKISENINTIDRLNNLYLLTVSDISAVDHGIWNDWKARLLKTLYTKIQNEVLKPLENKFVILLFSSVLSL